MHRHMGLFTAGNVLLAILLILVAGGVIAYLFSLDQTNPDARVAVSTTIMLTVLAVGLTLICATAKWWIHH